MDVTADLTPATEAIRARADAATPGPWQVYDAHDGDGSAPLWAVANTAYFADDGDADPFQAPVHYGCREDAEFIAHARDDVPALLELLAERGATIAQLRESNAHLIKNAETLADEIVHASATIAQLEKRLADEEWRHSQTIRHRDEAEDIVDRLTAAIERLLGLEFGERSNLNEPSHNAIEALRLAPTWPDWRGQVAQLTAERDQLAAEYDRAVAAIIVAHERAVDGSTVDDILDGYWTGDDHSQTVDDYIADGRIQPDPWRWADTREASGTTAGGEQR